MVSEIRELIDTYPQTKTAGILRWAESRKAAARRSSPTDTSGTASSVLFMSSVHHRLSRSHAHRASFPNSFSDARCSFRFPTLPGTFSDRPSKQSLRSHLSRSDNWKTVSGSVSGWFATLRNGSFIVSIVNFFHVAFALRKRGRRHDGDSFIVGSP